MLHTFKPRKLDAATAQVAREPAQSGVIVSSSNAMTCTAVRAAVEAIGEAGGGLPLNVHEHKGDARQLASDHPAMGFRTAEQTTGRPPSRSTNSFRRTPFRGATAMSSFTMWTDCRAN